jgi:DNA-binding LacI/PurR family transcriptional regulator
MTPLVVAVTVPSLSVHRLFGDLLDDTGDWIPHVLAEHRHVVAFGGSRVARPICSVTVDNTAGMRLLLEHLYGLGHRRIAYAGCQRNVDMQVRQESFLAFVAEKGLFFPAGYVQDASLLDYGDGYATAATIFATHPRPTAFIASNDRMAIGALRAAEEVGLRVPADVSIVGFDDLGIAAFSVPPLTTIRQPADRLGAAAVGLLVDLVEGRLDPSTGCNVVFEPELIVRASSGPPPVDSTPGYRVAPTS